MLLQGGDGGIYVGSIMKGGAVALDGRIEPGDMILQVVMCFQFLRFFPHIFRQGQNSAYCKSGKCFFCFYSKHLPFFN